MRSCTCCRTSSCLEPLSFRKCGESCQAAPGRHPCPQAPCPGKSGQTTGTWDSGRSSPLLNNELKVSTWSRLCLRDANSLAARHEVLSRVALAVENASPFPWQSPPPKLANQASTCLIGVVDALALHGSIQIRGNLAQDDQNTQKHRINSVGLLDLSLRALVAFGGCDSEHEHGSTCKSPDVAVGSTA